MYEELDNTKFHKVEYELAPHFVHYSHLSPKGGMGVSDWWIGGGAMPCENLLQRACHAIPMLSFIGLFAVLLCSC